MGRARSTRRRVLATTAVLLAATSCRLAPAKVWNLEQLHQADGRPAREAHVVGDFAYVVEQIMTSTGGKLEAPRAGEDRIDDPLGECFENVLALAEIEPDEKVVALQAATFAWLAVDCTYALSRERCFLALGGLARVLELPPEPPLAPAEPVDAEGVRAAFDALVATVREVRETPGMAGSSLALRAEEVRALPLDRAGAVRMLRGVNALLAAGERGAVLAPLRELRLELARRCTGLALRAGLADPVARARAAALEANLRAFPPERAALLRWALVEPMDELEDRDELRLRALEFLAEYGLPPAPPGADAAAFAREVQGVLVALLLQRVEGPTAVACCRALARIRGEAPSLRPEVWLARWRAESPPTEAPAP